MKKVVVIKIADEDGEMLDHIAFFVNYRKKDDLLVWLRRKLAEWLKEYDCELDEEGLKELLCYIEDRIQGIETIDMLSVGGCMVGVDILDLRGEFNL